MTTAGTSTDQKRDGRAGPAPYDPTVPAGVPVAGLPLEDLTARVQRFGPGMSSPFADDPTYAAVFDRLCRALHRGDPRHVLLVCDRGVGERAAVVELARLGVERTPPFLGDRRVVLVDCRLAPAPALWSMVEAWRDGLPVDAVLCLDGFAAVLRACGGWERRSVLVAALAAAAGRLVGLISPPEFEEHVAGAGDLRDLFSVVHLPEPAAAAAGPLVAHFARGLAAHYRVRIDDAAATRAIALTDSYVLNERLPQKAIRVLRAVCDDFDYDRTQRGVGGRDRVTEADVVAKVAHLTGIPESTLTGTGEAVDYRAALAGLVVGQDHAVQEVATELALIKAGMVDPGKPASVIMFVGQTGTGKTELAKALARLYSSSKRLKTFTLGNFSEPHSVSGIIGVPPGYVGHEQGGRLVNELAADPYGVFLLDEADKAHPDVMQPFLNLFDEGWVTDQRGVRAHAGRAIFILTTNVGQRQIADLCRAGKGTDEITATMKESLSRIRHTKSNRPVFTAEFLARVKRVIVFRSLSSDAMVAIARLLVAGVRRDWVDKRQKALDVPDGLVEAIGRQAYAIDDKSQGREGGRVVRKLIADFIEAPVQAAVGADPARYRACPRVVIAYEPADPAAPPSAGQVTVQFDASETVDAVTIDT